jgi:hypothetical protein
LAEEGMPVWDVSALDGCPLETMVLLKRLLTFWDKATSEPTPMMLTSPTSKAVSPRFWPFAFLIVSLGAMAGAVPYAG